MSKKLPKIISFASAVDADHSAPDSSRLIAGRPVFTTRNYFVDAKQQFYSGIWSSTEGRWRVSYTEHEFCSLLEGRVRLVSDDGSASDFGMGDSFVIPAGFNGTWETVTACRKLYVIYIPEPLRTTRRRAIGVKKKKVRRPRRK